MRVLRYAFAEAMTSLWRGRQSGLLSTATIALALFVLGGFLLVTANLERLGAEWGRAAELSVYLKDDISPEDRREIEELLAPGDTVASHEYVSKADALVRFKQTFADLAGAIEVALGEPRATVVCLCGRNEEVRAALAHRFGPEPRVVVLGFTDRMSDLLASAEVLVHSTAGLTVLEAIMRGCRVVSYGWGKAHVRVNNEAFVRHGLAEVARTRGELRTVSFSRIGQDARPGVPPTWRP